MFIGAHTIIYSTDPEADRAFLRDVLGLPFIDNGSGWLIFGLPPAEIAIHPAEHNNVHEFYLMVADIEAFVTRMQNNSIDCDPVEDLSWGRLTRVALLGRGKLGVYQPRHARPEVVNRSPQV